MITDRMSVDEQSILIFAMRYALGRQSTAPSTVVGMLIDKWSGFTASAQEQIQREIKEAIGHRLAGSSIDVKEWSKVLKLVIE